MVQPPPDLGQHECATYLDGLAPIDDRMVMILDLDKLRDSTMAAEAA